MPKLPSSPPSAGAWALTAYPISTNYRVRIEDRLKTPLEVTVLSELRAAGVVGVVRRLVSIRHSRGVVLVEDDSSQPIVPMLRFLISCTQCRELAVTTPAGDVVPFARAAALVEAIRILWGSVAGILVAGACAIELTWLTRQRPLRAGLRTLRSVAYLKTNLWFGLKAGGSVGHVAGVVDALARRCSVHVLSVERPPLIDPSVPHDAVGHAAAFGYPYELNYYRYQRLFARRGRALFRRDRPDFVYHRISLANYSGVRLARDLGIPLVVEFNGSEVWVSRHWGRPLLLPKLATKAEDVSLRHADLIVTVSAVLERQLLDQGVPRERILVHPNCVDPRRFDPASFSPEGRRVLLERHGIPASATVCGFIGTFGAWHGVTVLAEAIRDVVESDIDWMRQHQVHFLLVGDGILMRRVREILGTASAPFTTLTGLVPQEDAPRYLAACDVLLSPHVPNVDGSPFFGSPTKLFEYMALAKAIVASDLDQIGDVLRLSYHARSLPSQPCDESDAHLAILITPGSRLELITAIKFFVEHPDYRHILGRNARAEVLARYTWDRNVDELLHRLTALAASEALSRPGSPEGLRYKV